MDITSFHGIKKARLRRDGLGYCRANDYELQVVLIIKNGELAVASEGMLEANKWLAELPEQDKTHPRQQESLAKATFSAFSSY